MAPPANDDLTNMLAMMSINLPEFEAAIDEDPLKWLQDFERKTRYMKEETRKEQLVYCFNRTAKYWFTDQIEEGIKEMSWEAFKEKFISKFVNQEKRDKAASIIRRMTFELGENRVSNFLIDFNHWYCILYLHSTEEQKIADALDRFRIKFQSRLLGISVISEIETIKDLEKIAHKIEKSFLIETRNHVSSNAILGGTQSDTQMLLNEIKKLQNEVENLKSGSGKRQRKCYKCDGDYPKCGCKCSKTWPTCGCEYQKGTMKVSQGASNQSNSTVANEMN